MIAGAGHQPGQRDAVAGDRCAVLHRLSVACGFTVFHPAVGRLSAGWSVLQVMVALLPVTALTAILLMAGGTGFNTPSIVIVAPGVILPEYPRA